MKFLLIIYLENGYTKTHESNECWVLQSYVHCLLTVQPNAKCEIWELI